MTPGASGSLPKDGGQGAAGDTIRSVGSTVSGGAPTKLAYAQLDLSSKGFKIPAMPK